MTECTTPGGRIVWGNPLIGRTKTDQNNQPVIGADGKPVTQWSFGLAIPQHECGPIFQAMNAEATTLFPNGAPQNFAWKFKDGNGVDDKGQPFANREGYAGCYVFSISTEAFAPRVVRLVNGAYSDMTEGLKTGDYVRVALNIKAHAGRADRRGSVPGLYLNPALVEFLGFGTAIISGPDPMAVFGGQAAALPAGASATPIASGPMPGQVPGNGYPTQPGNPPGIVAPGMPPSPAPAAMPGHGTMPSNNGPHAPMPAYPSSMPAQPPTAPVQPAYDFVQQAGYHPTALPPAAGGVPGNGAPAAALPGMPPAGR